MTSKCDRSKKTNKRGTRGDSTYDVFTVFQTRSTYKLPGGLEGSVDTPVVEGIEVGVAVDDDPVEGGVSKLEYGVAVEPIARGISCCW